MTDDEELRTRAKEALSSSPSVGLGHPAYCPECDGPCQHRGSILASAAPDMAHVLLEVEWEGMVYGDSEPCCPTCLGKKVIGIHEPGCALDAALRKAGVR
jgi:hypothetical protein